MKYMGFNKALTIEGDFWIETGVDQEEQSNEEGVR